MALTSGNKLGPYEIQLPLGAGGMGEVYRANDTRLDRTVAIKILPSHLSENPEARQRFDREARAISSLNHPNICALYDVGHQAGVDYLVMEFLEGETLADRLRKGPLAPDQLLRYGIEICEGLEQAHRSGVIHRDLKPGNVMLTKAGAKLMDFGLAKSVEPALPPASSLTMTRSTPAGGQPLTAQGSVMGTFQYMSPEQVEGREADTRSDIFALGAVLYEMATGKRAFEGKTTASVIAAVLERNPPSIAGAQPMSPPALAQVVKTCLAKDPDERFQNAHDIKLQLKWIAEGGSQAGVAAPVISSRKRGERTRWIAAAVVMALLASWLGWQVGLRGSSSVPVHLTVMLPAGESLLNISTEPIAISPDGSLIAYSSYGDDRKVQLYLRKLGDFESTPLTGTEGAVFPFFSPNGEWLAFITAEDRKLKKVQLRGGSAVVVAEEAAPLGGAWADDDTIYFLREFTSGIYAVPAGGGQPRQVTQPGSTPDDRAQVWPDLLPGGNGLIFTVWTGRSFNEARIEALSFKTGKRKVLIEGGTGARYLSSGHLAYTRNGALFVVGFDPKSLQVKGTPVPVLEGVNTGASNGDADFAVSRNGTLVFQPGSFTSFQRNLVWMDRSGKATNITEQMKPYAEPAASPDGKRIALILQGSSFDVWVYDVERDAFTKASFGADDYRPQFSPDGKMLAYDSSKSGHQQVYMRHGIAQGQDVAVTDGPEDKRFDGWMPDGHEIVFCRQNKDTGWDLYAAAIEGDHKPRPLVVVPFNQTQARVSPDGKWLAYASDESGQHEIFIQSLSDPGMRAQISSQGGMEPRWARSGDELFFVSKERVMSVKFLPGGGLNPGKPVQLFEDKKRWSGYDVAADGRLMVARDADDKGTGNQINVVLHWFDELKQEQRK